MKNIPAFLHLLLGLLFLPFWGMSQSNLSCGQSTSGYLSGNNDNDVYLLSANNNDKLWLRVYASTNQIKIRIDIKNPANNATLFSQTAGASGFIEIPELALNLGDGQYRIVATNLNSGSGSYNLCAILLNKTSCADQVGCNEKSSENNYYSTAVNAKYISGSNNELLRVRLGLQTPDSEWRLAIRRPDGTLYGVIEHNGSGLIDTILQITAGNWFFYIYDEGGDESVSSQYFSYSFNILQKTTCADQVGCNEKSSDSYYYGAALNPYYIAASAGDSLRLRMYFNAPDPLWRLEIRRPNGSIWGVLKQDGYGLIDTVIPLSSGNWFFYVYAQNGDLPNTTYNYTYSFQILHKTTCADQVNCNEKSSDSYYYGAAINAYYLAASAGDSLRLRMYFISPDPEWRLEIRKPNGALWAILKQDGSGLIDTIIPLSSGNWYFYVYDADGDEPNTTHYYNYCFQLLHKTTCADQVGCNENSSDSYYYGAAINAYYLTASNGEKARIRFHFDSPDPEWRVEIRRPNGSLWGILKMDGSGLVDTIVPLSSGNWYFYVYDEGGDEPNSTHSYTYSFLILNKTTCADQVSCTEESSDSYYYGAAVNGYYVTAQGDETLKFRFYFEHPDPEWRVQLWNSTGPVDTFEYNGIGLLEKDIRLSAGNWYLYVYDEGGDEPTTTHSYKYSFQLIRPACTSSISCGGTANNSTYYGVATNAYSFFAEGCDTLTIQVTSSDPTFHEAVWLYGPNGELAALDLVNSNNDNARISTVLSPFGTGKYTVVAGETEGNNTGTYTVAVDCNSPYLFTANNVQTVSATGGTRSIQMQSDCPYWTASDNVSWLTITSPSGSMNGQINYAFDPNLHNTSRSAIITVIGCCDTIYISVNQEAATLQATPANINVNYQAGQASFSISGTCMDWSISENSPFIDSIVPSGGSGPLTITVYYQGNQTAGSRNATISINGCDINRSVVLTQTGVTLTLNPASLSVGQSAGQTSFDIASECFYWSVSENAAWLSVTPENGGGNSSISVLYEENCNSTPRSATITVTGCSITRTVTIVQSGATLVVSQNVFNVDHQPGTFNFLVSGTCCSWTVVSSETWLTVNAVQGSVTAVYGANTGASARTATITVSGCGITRTITVTQSGDATLVVTPTQVNIGSGAGQTNVDVFSNCDNWVATENSSWLFVLPGSGSNNGTVTIYYNENTGTSPRSAVITFSGCGITVTVTVVQEGQPNYVFDVSTYYLGIGPEAGVLGFNTLGNCSGWTLSESVNWLALTPESGSGSEPISVQVAENCTAAPRNATITAYGCGTTKTITVAQEAATLYVGQTAFNVGPQAGSYLLHVSGSCCSWDVFENAAWLTLSVDQASGTVTIICTENTGGAPRTANLIVSGCGQSYSIPFSQQGDIILIPSVSDISIAWDSTISIFNLFTNCNTWTVSDNASWLFVLPGSGTPSDSTLTLYCNQNLSGSPRNAVITLNGCGLTVYIYVHQDALTATLEPESVGRLLLSPNPAQTFVEVLIPENGGEGRLCLYDLRGTLLQQTEVEAGQRIRLAGAHLCDGLYVLQYFDRNGRLLANGKVIFTR